jgi:glycosyltransferase involved in cell wall biosynthesis
MRAVATRDRPRAEREDTRRLKVLISAYACQPGEGSEPGVGWNVALEAARRHDVWVITRAVNRPEIEAELARHSLPSLHMIYYDLPRWTRWWKRGPYGARLYYHVWQLASYPFLRRLYRETRFDVSHHVTFVSYWKPSLLPFFPAPFLWGPVGGAESAPKSFQADFGWHGRLYEVLRSIARRCGESDPLVVTTARRSALALAVTEDTAQRLRAIGAKHVAISSEAGLSAAERLHLGSLSSPPEGEPVRFISVGRMLHWKGFHLGLRAFATTNMPHLEYWLIGEGPYRTHLERLARRLGVENRVRFCGVLPRAEVLAKLARCHILVHPSLHDSGGWVCLEAMAAGRPVICLDLGGPGEQVTTQTGFKIPARDPAQAVEDMARAMTILANDSRLRIRMGQAGRQRVALSYAWERQGETLGALYQRLAGTTRGRVSTVW